MVWSSLFVFSVPLWQRAEGIIERPEEDKRTALKTAAWLQIVHHFLNTVALVVCILLRPEDYIFIPGNIIWLYLVIGIFSSLSVVGWLTKLLYEDQRDIPVKEQSSNLLEENAEGRDLATDAQNPQSPQREGFAVEELTFEIEENAGPTRSRGSNARKDLKIKLQ